MKHGLKAIMTTKMTSRWIKTFPSPEKIKIKVPVSWAAVSTVLLFTGFLFTHKILVVKVNGDRALTILLRSSSGKGGASSS